MVNIAVSLRKEIRRQGLTNEAFAEKWGLSNGTLYALLAGGLVGSLATARKLHAAGVRLPRELLSAA
jgi:hypothetical protein